MKKLFFVLLLTSLCFMCAFSEEEIFSNGYYQYRVLEDGTIEITKYSGEEKRIVVPDNLDGYKVTVIGDDSFERLWSTESIILPEGIRKIGNSAFYNCQFRAFTIPDGVTEIGNSAFNSCYSLESLVVPDSVVSIGRYAFDGCGEIFLPDTITRIEEGTFSESDFTEITLPSNLTYLGESAFSGNTYLRQISIPAGVTAILDGTFAGCDSLTTVILPNTVRGIQSTAFQNCLNLERVYIPESVTVIDFLAFYEANPNVTIVCAKGSKAEEFAREQGFNIEYPTTEEEEMRNFSYMVKADGTLSITGYVGKRIDIAIPASIDGMAVTAVSPAAFAGVTKLASVTLPDGLTAIGEYAFLGSKSLESILIPESVSEIGEAFAFYCPNLTLKVFENSKAHSYAVENGFPFELCIPAEPEHSDFAYMENGDGSLSITDYTGEETAVVVPSVISGKPVTALSAMAFTSTGSYVTVTLPDGLESIGDFCFLGNQKIELLVVPASVTQIGTGVGLYCPKLSLAVEKNSFAHEYAVTNDIPFLFSIN